ncbi:MAG: HD domain-containing protein [Chloroflexi bacterium]|nr:HD domain-containing protein [Chloroflexota bacterium]
MREENTKSIEALQRALEESRRLAEDLEKRNREVTALNRQAREILASRSQALAELEQRNRELEAVSHIAAVCNQYLEPMEVAQAAADKVVEVLPQIRMVSIWEVTEKGDELVLLHRAGPAAPLFSSIQRRKMGEGPIGLAAQGGEAVLGVESGKAVLTEELSQLRRQTMEIAEKAAIVCLCALPLKWRNDILGVMGISCGQAWCGGKEPEPLLAAIAEQVAGALGKARLYRDKEWAARRNAALNQMIAIINSKLDPRKTFAVFTQQMKQLVDFDRAAIVIIDRPRGKVNVFTLAAETATELPQGYEVPLEGSPSEWVAAHRAPHVAYDLMEKREFPLDDLHLREGRRSYVRVPLFYENEVLGILSLGGRLPHAYGKKEVDILQELAGPVATAVVNFRLYQEIKEKAEALAREHERVLDGIAVLEGSRQRLQEAYLDMGRTLVLMLEARDFHLRGHSERVAFMTDMICREMGLSEERRRTAHTAAILHDVGKIGVPDSILLKPGPLDPHETSEVRLHVSRGVDLLRYLDFLKEAVDIVKAHHERYDGSGYPRGLKGEAIPLEARIMAVADVYDANTSGRPYQPAVSSTEATAEIEKGAGSHFDPQVVAALLRCIEK